MCKKVLEVISIKTGVIGQPEQIAFLLGCKANTMRKQKARGVRILCAVRKDSTKYMEKIPWALAFAPIGFAPSVPIVITT